MPLGQRWVLHSQPSGKLVVPFKWSPPGMRAGPQGRGSGSSIDRVCEIPEWSEMTGFTRSLDTFESLWTFEDWLFPHHPGHLRASGCPHPSMWAPVSPLPNSCPLGPDLLFPLCILGMPGLTFSDLNSKSIFICSGVPFVFHVQGPLHTHLWVDTQASLPPRADCSDTPL